MKRKPPKTPKETQLSTQSLTLMKADLHSNYSKEFNFFSFMRKYTVGNNKFFFSFMRKLQL